MNLCHLCLCYSLIALHIIIVIVVRSVRVVEFDLINSNLIASWDPLVLFKTIESQASGSLLTSLNLWQHLRDISDGLKGLGWL